jgi:hypothetical protein
VPQLLGRLQTGGSEKEVAPLSKKPEDSEQERPMMHPQPEAEGLDAPW